MTELEKFLGLLRHDRNTWEQNIRDARKEFTNTEPLETAIRRLDLPLRNTARLRVIRTVIWWIERHPDEALVQLDDIAHRAMRHLFHVSSTSTLANLADFEAARAWYEHWLSRDRVASYDKPFRQQYLEALRADNDSDA